MGKTIQVAADRANDQTKTVVPTEYARALHIKNAPSLRALKLMHLMIATAGERMADDTAHCMRMKDIERLDGMNHYGKESLKPIFEELRAVVLTYDDPDAMRFTVGGFLDHAKVGYQTDEGGDTLVVWYFGRLFREMAAESDHWTILDRQTVFHLTSRYAVLLFQHMSSFLGLRHVKNKSFTVAEIRAVLGIKEGVLPRFADVNRRALKVAIAEINKMSRFTLDVTQKRLGRSAKSVDISWELKPEPTPEPTPTPMTASEGKTPVTPAKAFPATGSIEFSKPWNDIAKLNGNGKDKDLIATDFRNWCQMRNIPLDRPNIEKTFAGFCKGAKI